MNKKKHNYFVIVTVFLVAFLIIAIAITTFSRLSETSSKTQSSPISKLLPNANQSVNHKFHNNEYALAAYLKLANQSASELKQASGNMHWTQNNNNYLIGFGAHTTKMKVNENNVIVTYDDIQGNHMGEGNGHKSYTKQQLNQLIENQRSTIDSLLSSHSSNNKNNIVGSYQDSQDGAAITLNSDGTGRYVYADPTNPDTDDQLTWNKESDHTYTITLKDPNVTSSLTGKLSDGSLTLSGDNNWNTETFTKVPGNINLDKFLSDEHNK